MFPAEILSGFSILAVGVMLEGVGLSEFMSYFRRMKLPFMVVVSFRKGDHAVAHSPFPVWVSSP